VFAQASKEFTMKRWSVIAALVVALGSGKLQAQPASGERDLGSEVRGVFAAKCAACHGPDLPKPQGRFGYVLDLKRVASNPEMVIPGKPDESELWAMVSHGDMPPTDAPRGPLTAAEKETIREWIAAGAPEVRVQPSGAPAPHESEQSAAPQSLTPTDRMIRFLGKFHLLLLHFPIALLITAGVGELLSLRHPQKPSEVSRFCLTLAAIAVIPTVALGWLHAASGYGVGSAQMLSLHRWLGTITGAWVLIVAVCVWRDSRRGRFWRGRIMLAVGIVLVLSTAHAGGLLAHGRDFFDW
jgi:uncharacterized membrane protein/mono/diheme cytochrome c family protein